MKKIPTIFPKDPNNLSIVIKNNPINNINHFKIKIDGTACLIKNEILYARYDAKLFKKKKGKIINFSKEEIINKLPEGAIPCQEPDKLSGHWPHWVPVNNNPEYKYILEAFNNLKNKIDGTYECVGPKINNNPHNESKHILIPHFEKNLIINIDNKDIHLYDYLNFFLKDFPYEGLVAYNNKNEPIAKIRRSDFGYSKIKYNKASELIEG